MLEPLRSLINDRPNSVLTLLGLLIVYMTVDLLIQLGPIGGSVSGERLTARATVYLVIVTGMYVLFTYGLLEETAAQREQNIQPAFAVQTVSDGVRVRNVGNGAALQTEITISVIPKQGSSAEATAIIHNQDIPADDSMFISYHSDDAFSGLGKHPHSEDSEDYLLQVDGSYTDIYQNEKKIEERIYEFAMSDNRMFTEDVTK